MKQIMPNNTFEYWHFNHPKVNLDVQIPLTNLPTQLDHKVQFYEQGEVMAINTWVGARWDIFEKHQGANLNSIYEGWCAIYDKLQLKIRDDAESYLPRIDFSFYNISKVDEYIKSSSKKKILICNGKPMSNQSFDSDMSDLVNELAAKNDEIDFICTKKFITKLPNVLFTDDIIQDNEQFLNGVNTYWVDLPKNVCDLNEISYLSTFCNAIIGKNSGPFTFCGTYDNLKDPNKLFVSFCNAPNESMSIGTKVAGVYLRETDLSEKNIRDKTEWVINEIKT